jgi:hypothetical protein
MAGSVRQEARRAAQDKQAQMRRDRETRERRVAALGVGVAVALGERESQERRAGAALREMTVELGLSLRDAVSWTGTDLGLGEARRLLRLAADRSPQAPATAPVSAGTGQPATTTTTATTT